jgi:hypothetical protein
MLLENFPFDARLNTSVSQGFPEHLYLKIENQYDYRHGKISGNGTFFKIHHYKLFKSEFEKWILTASRYFFPIVFLTVQEIFFSIITLT